jgi:hypothetical protein
MKHRFTATVWFAVLVAWLVALGARSVIGSLLAIDLQALFADPPRVYQIVADERWTRPVMVQLLSWAAGAFVGGSLADAMSRRLAVSLMVVLIVNTVFQQFPLSSMVGNTLWALSGLSGLSGVAMGLFLAWMLRGRVL